MKLTKLSTSVCLGLLTSSVVLAEGAKTSSPDAANPNASAAKSSEKPSSPTKASNKKSKQQLTFFEGCGRKGKDGKWAEFYSNCDTEENGKEIPAPPCKEGWVKVKEAVPQNMVSHLQRCVIEL